MQNEKNRFKFKFRDLVFRWDKYLPSICKALGGYAFKISFLFIH